MSLWKQLIRGMIHPQDQQPQQPTPQVQVQPAPQQPQPNSLSQYAGSPFQQISEMFQPPQQQQMPDGTQNLQQPQKKGGLFSALLKAFRRGRA